jgi:hypothetical protein
MSIFLMWGAERRLAPGVKNRRWIHGAWLTAKERKGKLETLIVDESKCKKDWICAMTVSSLKAGRLAAAIILCSIILTVLSGCSMANYGQLRSNKEVTQKFENYQILPNHKYYYRGTYSRPLAVVGIKEQYELNSKLWLGIDLKSNDFRTIVDRVSLQGSGSTTHPWGFTILDPSGRDVGVWYSAIRAAAVEINENGQIVNLSPLRTVAIGNQR